MSELSFLTHCLPILPEITKLINQTAVDVDLNRPCFEKLRYALERNHKRLLIDALQVCIPNYSLDYLQMVVSGILNL